MLESLLQIFKPWLFTAKNDRGPQKNIQDTPSTWVAYAYWLYLSFILRVVTFLALIHPEGGDVDDALVKTGLLFQSCQNPLETSNRQEKNRQTFEMTFILFLRNYHSHIFFYSFLEAFYDIKIVFKGILFYEF